LGLNVKDFGIINYLPVTEKVKKAGDEREYFFGNGPWQGDASPNLAFSSRTSYGALWKNALSSKKPLSLGKKNEQADFLDV
jgi:hypothetical protein